MASRKTVGIKDLKINHSAYPREVQRWARAGIVTLPNRPVAPVSKSPARLPNGTAARLLNEDRRDRGR